MSDDVHVCMPIDTRGRGCDASVNYKCVVRESELLLERVEVVRHHHELWDGLRFLTDLFFFLFFFRRLPSSMLFTFKFELSVLLFACLLIPTIHTSPGAVCIHVRARVYECGNLKQ